MKKFVVLYHASASALEQMAGMSPEEIKKGMEPWMAWAAKCGDALVDFGSPLVGGRKLAKAGTSSPSDKEVTGYSILQADSIEAAQALLKGHPHLERVGDGGIEVHESVELAM